MNRKEQIAVILRSFGPTKIRALLQTPEQLKGPLPRGGLAVARDVLGVSRSSLALWLDGENSPAVEAAIARLRYPTQALITDRLADRAAAARTLGRPVPLAPDEVIALLPISEEEQRQLLPRLRARLDAEDLLRLLLPLVSARFAELLWKACEPSAEEKEQQRQKEQIEARAKEIYNGWKFDPEWRPWRERGNSLMQDLARSQAAEELFPQVEPWGGEA